MSDSITNPISAQVIWQRHRAGEPLVLAIKAIGLRDMNRATVLRWILSGRVPAIRLGRRYLTVQSLVDELAISGKLGAPLSTSRPPVPRGKKGKPRAKKPGANAHAQAVESLRRKGLMS